MLFEHPDHAGKRVRLAYCLNLHPAHDLDTLLEGVRTITLPLQERLAGKKKPFGVGLYLPAALASNLAADRGRRDLERLSHFLAEHRLEPFTFNAFPAGGFHEGGLKQGVFRPTWLEEERVRFTLDVAQVAARLLREVSRSGSHVSISTHSGAFGPWPRGEQDARRCAQNLGRVAQSLLRLGLDGGLRFVLALEAEPRATAGDSASLARFLERVPEWTERSVDDWVLSRGIGTCLDACHSAVEFEDPRTAFGLATARSLLGKLQYSSAISLPAPAEHPRAILELLAMDEPRYLHQVTGLTPSRRASVNDLPALRQELAGPSKETWLACREWRCHFHVPVDLDRVGGEGLRTTRNHAAAILDAALDDPRKWGTEELHLEIETYTWEVLPSQARGAGEMVDGLHREYEHVIGRLESRGWRLDGAAAG
ncbi:MAG: metabolite traffic protein EboE [Planctomycetota bacterium]